MITVEELATGVFRVDAMNGTTFEHDEASLPPDLRDKLMMLRAADLHTRIEGVGTRLGEHLYWITEEGEAEPTGLAGIIAKLQFTDGNMARLAAFGLKVDRDITTHTLLVAEAGENFLWKISCDMLEDLSCYRRTK